MSASTGIMLALGLVLLGAGVGKLVAPQWTRPALRAVSLPSSDTVVRVIGVAEVLVTFVAMMWGGVVAGVLYGTTYAAFAVFAAALVRRAGAGTDCGCFGETSEPVTWTHTVVNTLAAVVAFVSIAWPPAPLGEMFVELGWLSGAMLLGVVALAWLLRAMLSALPALQIEVRR